MPDDIQEPTREITILVLGVSNSGKSTFVNWMAESLSTDAVPKRVGVRGGMTAETDAVTELLIRSPDGVEIRLVDTPGLEHTDMPDAAVFRDITTWLEDSFKMGRRVNAIFYLHDISREWITSTMRLDFEVLSKLCGRQVMSNGMVTIVTTRWSSVPPDEGSVKERELMGDLWSGVGGTGAPLSVERVADQRSVHHLRDKFLPRLLARDTGQILNIQYELVNLGLALDATDAGRCFNVAGPPKFKSEKYRLPQTSPKQIWPLTASKAAKLDPQDPVLQNACNSDIVIPLMGQTKAGKSSLINALLGYQRMAVGEEMTSCTKHLTAVVAVSQEVPQAYRELRAALEGRRIVFLDTPGFDDTEVGDDEVLIRIAKWLETSYRKEMLVGGVLYLHDITKDGWTGTSKSNLSLFAKICGDDAMNQVVLLTTKWRNITHAQEGHAVGRTDELKTHWGRLIGKGASVHHLQPPNRLNLANEAVNDPWELIQKIVRTMEVRGALLLQQELVVDRRFIGESQAGKELYASLQDRLKKAKVDQRAGGTQDSSSKSAEERQRDIDALKQQLTHLKPAMSQRLIRWVNIPFPRQSQSMSVLP